MMGKCNTDEETECLIQTRDERSETNRVGVQTLTASRNKLLLICIAVHVCFS